MGKSSKDKRDIYYRLAKENGYRARSAYKLLQLDALYHFLDDANLVLDLCAAPGSWSQVVSQRFKSTSLQSASKRSTESIESATIDHANNHNDTRHSSSGSDNRIDEQDSKERKMLVAIDLQKMAPLPHTIQLQGDLTSPTTQAQLQALFPLGCDLVICDGAPDVTGLHDLDTFLHAQLFTSCFHVVCRTLRPGGTFIAKMFKGGEDELVQECVGRFFQHVSWCKPLASRAASMETFLVCQGFKADVNVEREMGFLEHGDLSIYNSA